jgi:NADH-quinone oxidoreductase subunit N
MFSLTGLPPLAGFWGKLTLFTGALGVDAKDPDGSGLWGWFLALAVVGALNAAISAGYYLRIVGVMYFSQSEKVPEAGGGSGPAWAAAVCAALVLSIGCYPGPFVERANRASQAVRATLAEPSSGSVETATKQPNRATPSVEPVAGSEPFGPSRVANR